MLTYDSLLEQARLRGMPLTKMRGILREYLQVLILKEFHKSECGSSLYFTGGTYLRLAHDVKRFSEDLDFNAARLERKRFERIINGVGAGLAKSGIRCRVSFAHFKNIFVSRLLFPDIERAYGVVSRYSKKEGIIIKLETNTPAWPIKSEANVISGFGEVFPCVCTDRSALFADKIDALTKKNRGRHLYDIIFMLSNHFPMAKNVLKALGVKGDPADIILKRVREFSQKELKNQAEVLRPFLFNESEADLIINAHIIVPALLKKYTSAT